MEEHTNFDIPLTEEQKETSDRLQDLTQNIQEQAFLLGYRNGFREGELVQDLLRWIKNAQADPTISQERLNVLRSVEHYLVDKGAYLDDPEDGEITYPPGMMWYLGGFEASPMIQVAGERIETTAFHFDWVPNPHTEDGGEDFEPERDQARIELDFTISIPEGSSEREALLEFLEGLR